VGIFVLRLDLDLKDSLARRLQPEALVVQEDRNLVMSAPAAVDLDVEDELDAAYVAISAHRPLPVGRYLLRRPRAATPYWTYQAVVHDLEQSPTCRPGDVRRSLIAILSDAQKRGLEHLAVEPIGHWRDAGLPFTEMVEALDATIFELTRRLVSPCRMTLLLDNLEQLEEVSHLLRSRLLRRASRSFHTVTGDVAVVEVRERGDRLHFRFVPGSLSGYMVTRSGDVA
jgi:hypothetical protein